MKRRFLSLAAVAGAAAAVLSVPGTSWAGKPSPTSTAFSNVPLTVPLTNPPSGVTSATTGDSEPAVSIGTTGRMVVGGLSWIPSQVNMWTGTAGSAPSFFGAMDQNIALNGSGRTAVGDGDEAFDLGSTGTIHFADLIFVSPGTSNQQLGVSETNCPAAATSPSQCNRRVLDTSSADRQWLTSNGRQVWLSYHDSGNSTLIHVDYSADDGATWTKVGSPIPGQGAATGDATFNNDQGPIVADPTTGDVFDIYAAGQPGIQKATAATFNNIYVSRSTDNGAHWNSTLVFSAPLFTGLNNVFPALAVDPVTGRLYASWTDTHGVAVSVSSDHGASWSAPVTVSSSATTVMPWVAAYNGKVDVVYYGTSAASNTDPTAVWNAYDAQLRNGSWSQVKVSNTPNHMGEICLEGAACPNQDVTRTLLDLFQVAENPLTGKATVIYTDDTFHTWVDNGTTFPLPEIVFAQEK
jgi:hypothetical protein